MQRQTYTELEILNAYRDTESETHTHTDNKTETETKRRRHMMYEQP